MQILTKKQVKYCRLVTEKPANTKYCLGVHFQNKLFVSNKFFPGDRRQEAIEYCQNSYLNDGGKRAYLLVINVAGLTVWQEDKDAHIVGKQSSEDFIAELQSENFTAQVQGIAEVFNSDISNNFLTFKLIAQLKSSLQKIANLEYSLQSGFWLKSGESIEPFNHTHRFSQFN